MFLAIGGREIFEQLDLVSTGRFHYREFDLGTAHSRNLTGHFARLMRAMRKLKAENVLPEFERAFEIRNRNAGVIGGDAKRGNAHLIWKPGNQDQEIELGKQECRKDLNPFYPCNPRLNYFPIAAITLSSIAIGV